MPSVKLILKCLVDVFSSKVNIINFFNNITVDHLNVVLFTVPCIIYFYCMLVCVKIRKGCSSGPKITANCEVVRHYKNKPALNI